MMTKIIIFLQMIQKGTWQLANIVGIPVRVHWSFAFILVLIGYNGLKYDLSIPAVALYSAFIFLMFVSVLLHELGHAFSARAFGVRTTDVTIYPIGGAARLERTPERPLEEMLVAMAGPATNFVIALLIALVLWCFFDFRTTPYIALVGESHEDFILSRHHRFWFTILQGNAWLAMFNMLPAFPLDGGRVLRSLMSIHFSRLTATRWATIIGQIFAVGFVVYSFWAGHPILWFFGGLIFLAARQEYRSVQLETRFADYTVADILITQYPQTSLKSTVGEVVDSITHQEGGNFLVFDDTWGEKKLVGVLIDTDLLTPIREKRWDEAIEKWVRPNFDAANINDNLKNVYNCLRNSDQSQLPVFDEQGKLIGVVEWVGLQKILEI